MRNQTWLFVRGEESVWLQTVSERHLLMRGPSVHRTHKAFEDGQELARFIAHAEERLLASGWTLHRLGAGEDRRRTVLVHTKERRAS